MADSATSWQPVLTGELARSATARALEVAGRLRDRDDAEPGLDGSAGRAILFGQLDRVAPGQGWDHRAHQALTSAVRQVESIGRNHPGLYVGYTGVAAAAEYLSRDGSRYGGLLNTLDGPIAAAAADSSQMFVENPAHQPFEAFDLIYGLTGTNRYLLERGQADLAGLVALCDSDVGEPHWFTPPEAIRKETAIAEWYDGGVYNCGLAHGIPGPLALLALAYRRGVVVPRQAEAIAAVAEWLVANRADDEWGPNWTACVTPGGPSPVPAQSGWCYGSPGVAHTLWLAGTALDDAKLREVAIEAMAAVYRRPWSARQIGDSPGLCHGVAGLLQITLRLANATKDPMFSMAAVELTERLLEMYRPEIPTGYYSRKGIDGSLREHPGLLDGAAGAALALLAASTPTEPVWDHVLLLS